MSNHDWTPDDLRAQEHAEREWLKRQQARRENTRDERIAQLEREAKQIKEALERAGITVS